MQKKTKAQVKGYPGERMNNGML